MSFRLLTFSLVALIAACSATSNPPQGNAGGSGNSNGSGGSGATGGSNASGGNGAGGTTVIQVDAGAGASGAGQTCDAGPNEDKDHDGWTIAQGDCNDCDPNVNPGAIDVLHQHDGGPPTWGDEDCDGTPGDSAKACDQGLALDDVNASDGAKAIELCQTATATDRKFGVLSAAYVRADGSTFSSPGLQVGLESGWGSNVKPQAGSTMLVLSSGHARAIGQPGACGSLTCKENATGTAPPGFPQANPACPPASAISDDVALEVKLRAPTNATGYSFNFKFYSFEFPESVCDKYNDQFIALVSPAPQGSINGNISFDNNHVPVSVDLAYFDVCDPSTASLFAYRCKQAGGTCPSLPNPYCPLGAGDLQGTGFDVWKQTSFENQPTAAGATAWLESQAPIQGGQEFTIRFAIWDTGNQQYDSTVLIDNFQWLAQPGVSVTTTPVPAPK
jgi:hypothetical protein